MFKLLLGLVLWAVTTAASASQLAVDPKTTGFVLGPVEGPQVYDILDRIAQVDRAGGKRFTLVIDSPGGYVNAGLKLTNVMRLMQARGMRFDCMVTGIAMSMAYYILSACDYRYALPTAQLLWHPIRISFRGALTGIEAQNIGRTLISYENFMKSQLIERMGCGADWFEAHWLAETQWHAEDLRTEVPRFLRIVNGVKGLPASALFHVPKPSFGFFDKTDIVDKPELLWEH